MAEQSRRNEPPQKLSYEFRHILHVVDQSSVGSEEEWRESIREMYRQLDAGTLKKTRGKKDAMGDLRPDYAEFRKLADQAVQDAGSAANAENELLRSELAELKTIVNDLVIKLSGNDDTQPREGLNPVTIQRADRERVEPETSETVGPGACPTCKKTFKRLDMHVCKEAA